MAYSVHNFEQGDILYADQLNEMDAQIALNEQNINSGISSDMLAEDYSANKTYSIGDYVMYNNELYRCIYEITAAEGWNSAHWQKANLGDGISDLNRQISDVESAIDEYTHVKYGKNRFDKNAITTGGYLGSDGSIIPHANWCTSGFCYVAGFEKAVCSINGGLNAFAFCCTYDQNKNFITQLGSSVASPMDVPNGVYYIRFSFGTNQDTSTILLEEGTTPTSYTAYEAPTTRVNVDTTLSEKDMPADAYSVGQKFITGITDTVSFTEETLTMIQGKLLNGSTGAITDSSSESYTVSNPVEVVGGSKVSITARHFYGQGLYAFYDENNTFISGRSSEGGATVTYLYGEIVDVPINAKYLVIGNLYDSAYVGYIPVLLLGNKSNALPSARWSGIKWACIGDSLTAHNSRTTRHYYDYVKEHTGIEVEVLGVSGTGYAKGGSTDSFYARIANIGNDVDVVTIFGSFNDLSSGLQLGTVTDSDTTTIAGCINETIDALLTALPVVKLGIVAPTPWKTTQPSISGNAYNYVEMLKSICEHRSIPFLDLWRGSNLRPWDNDFLQYAYSKDEGNGLHPDETGHEIISSHFQSFLETLLLH